MTQPHIYWDISTVTTSPGVYLSSLAQLYVNAFLLCFKRGGKNIKYNNKIMLIYFKHDLQWEEKQENMLWIAGCKRKQLFGIICLLVCRWLQWCPLRCSYSLWMQRCSMGRRLGSTAAQLRPRPSWTGWSMDAWLSPFCKHRRCWTAQIVFLPQISPRLEITDGSL